MDSIWNVLLIFHSVYSLIGLVLRTFLQNNKNPSLLLIFFLGIFSFLPHTEQSLKLPLNVDLTGK